MTTNGNLADERAVMVCPQCEGEGSYADGRDEAACTTECTRCGSNGWIVDLAALRPTPAPDVVEAYDAGILNDYGGGDVNWWQDYIRAELERAHEHYQSQFAALSQSPDVAAHGFRAITPKSSAHAAVLNDLARRIDDE